MRVKCAAHGSAENKSFQISGASNLSEIKEEAGRKLLPRRPALSCSLASGVGGGVARGIPLPLSWPVPGNQPPFFLFHTGKASRFPRQTSRRLSCLQSGMLSAGRMIKYHCGLKKKKKSSPCYYYSLGLKECFPLAHYCILFESGDCRCRAEWVYSHLCAWATTRNPRRGGTGDGGWSPKLLATASGFRIPQNSWREQHQVKQYQTPHA